MWGALVLKVSWIAAGETAGCLVLLLGLDEGEG